MVYGLSAALRGDTRIDKGGIVQSNFHDIRALRMNEMPLVESYLVDSREAPGGIGEPGTAVFKPALANAVLHATGRRVRELPIAPLDRHAPAQENANEPIALGALDRGFVCAYNKHIMSSTNTRFRTAMHALAVIAYIDAQQATSDQIAASVATDATVVRRLLSALREAGLVQAVEGRAGGYALGRSAQRISLLDVYRAVGPDTLFPLPERRPNPDCPVGAHIHAALDGPLDAAHAALEQRLAATSLADVMARIAGP